MQNSTRSAQVVGAGLGILDEFDSYQVGVTVMIIKPFALSTRSK